MRYDQFLERPVRYRILLKWLNNSNRVSRDVAGNDGAAVGWYYVFEGAQVNGTSTDKKFCLALLNSPYLEIYRLRNRQWNSCRKKYSKLDVGRWSTDFGIIENIISKHRNCTSISYRRTAISISGFMVAMLPVPDRVNSCRTKRNFMSEDVSSTLASSKHYLGDIIGFLCCK